MKYYPPRFLFRRQEILSRIKRGDEFLEIGAGNLYLARDLLHYFDRGTVVDSNPDIAEIYAALSESLKKRLCLYTEDLFKLVPSLGRYDCVIACEVLEHVENDDEFLARICSLLNPDGQLVVSVPARMKYWSRHDELVGHFRRYEKDSIAEAVFRQGLTNVKVISYGFPFVNLLRLPRIALAYLQSIERSSWTRDEQTRRSAILRAPTLVNLAGLVCNKYSVYPFSLASSIFNDLELSDGYIITAQK
jgi:SAM-dependent methyltransferase